MTALYDRPRIVRLRREALPMPNIFEPGEAAYPPARPA
jgi:hypothetical protein